MDCVFTTHQGTYVEGPLIGQRTPNTSVFAEPFRNLLGWTTDEINARFGPADFRIHSGDSVSLKITHEVTDVKMGGQDTMVIVGIP
ncbi:hypothetical protein C8K11_12016 [Novosphingobium sp. GV055]|nr:hypothetical protein C8K11_12016 [Novosphingobium sp. GV055]PUA94822.1 hypothetical protein C8K12_12016 [Novosphingobium sp. GV061]PUB13747.1 hypothetical protein C8K14_12016 [Novosphingobium sp. GV079]PUB38445.1 hypothetical protein C8K10_12016 [Novosphingobium sp. GV027]